MRKADDSLLPFYRTLRAAPLACQQIFCRSSAALIGIDVAKWQIYCQGMHRANIHGKLK